MVARPQANVLTALLEAQCHAHWAPASFGRRSPENWSIHLRAWDVIHGL